MNIKLDDLPWAVAPTYPPLWAWVLPGGVASAAMFYCLMRMV